MAVSWFFKDILVALLLPPGNGLLLLLLAGIFRRRRWAFGLAVLGATLIYLQSLPLISHALTATLERQAGPVVHDTGGCPGHRYPEWRPGKRCARVRW